jgi:hypothetical protein
LVAVAMVAAWAAACEAEKSRTPTSPNVAGPIAGVSITAPAPVSPANGAEVLNTEPVRLVFGNASSNSERSFWYVVELAADAGFTQKLYTNPRVTPASGQQTSVVVEGKFAVDATHYWRVKADDGANSSDFSPTAHFDVVVPIVIDPPQPASPVGGATTANNTPTLVVTNGRVEGRAGRVEYRYEVASDQGFINIVSVALVPRNDGSTTSHTSAALPAGSLLFWRATGTNGVLTSAPSAVQSFRTPAPPGPGPGPAPGPTPPGSGSACGPPYPTTEVSIVECQRSKYGYMGAAELVAFLRAVARDLNKYGFSGGPFGLLVKTGGNNCGGYSCDIVCSGQGGGQRQWDVLGDAEGAQSPKWDGPIGGITVRPCEIQ